MIKYMIYKISNIFLHIRIWIVNRKIKKARKALDKSVKENNEVREELGLPKAWDLKP